MSISNGQSAAHQDIVTLRKFTADEFSHLHTVPLTVGQVENQSVVAMKAPNHPKKDLLMV